MSTPEVVSLAQFSRMHGVSRKTASEWKRAGHLVMSDDGGVVVGPSNEKLRERTRRYRGGVTRGPSRRTARTPAPLRRRVLPR
jgi:hypothetical protein